MSKKTVKKQDTSQAPKAKDHKDRDLYPAELEIAAKSVLGGGDAKEIASKMAIDFDFDVKKVTDELNKAVQKELDRQAEEGQEKAKASAKDVEAQQQLEKEAKAASAAAEAAAATALQKQRDALASAAKADGKVFVNVPKNYILTLDNGTKLPIKAGPQSMPEALAKHWYSKANGVEIVK